MITQGLVGLLLQSPLLMTSKRARPSYMKSQQQLEEEELERLRKEQFRAKPLE